MRKGIAAACYVFIGYNLMHPYVGPFYKPHEGFWRAIAAIGVLYMCFLTFLLFQVTTNINRYRIQHLLGFYGRI